MREKIKCFETLLIFLLLAGLTASAMAQTNIGVLEEKCWSIIKQELESSDPGRRHTVLSLLADVPTKRSAKLIERGLYDKYGFVRNAALLALYNIYAQGGISNEEMINYLAHTMKDADSLVRGKTAEVLGKADIEAAIPMLEQMLSDSEWVNRNVVAQGLATKGSAAVPALLKALKNTDVHVRAIAAAALGKSGEKGDSKVIFLLEGALYDPNVDVRRNAAESLVRLEKASYLSALEEILRDSSASARVYTAARMYNLGHRSYVEVIINALKGRDPYLREIAIKALSELKDDKNLILPLLSQALSDPEAPVRLAALDVLDKTRAGRLLAKEVERLTKDNNEFVRFKAFKILADAGFAIEASSLEELLIYDNLKADVIGLLGSIGGAAQLLVKALEDKDPLVRKNALDSILLRKEGGIALRHIVDLLKDPDLEVRRKAIKALVEIHGLTAVDFLKEALEGKDRNLRLSVAIALIKLA